MELYVSKIDNIESEIDKNRIKSTMKIDQEAVLWENEWKKREQVEGVQGIGFGKVKLGWKRGIMGNKSTLKRCDKNDKQSMRLSQSTRYKLQSAFGVNSMKPLARSVSKLKPKKQHRFYKGTHQSVNRKSLTLRKTISSLSSFKKSKTVQAFTLASNRNTSMATRHNLNKFFQKYQNVYKIGSMKSSISDQQNREIEKIIEQMSKPEKVVMLDQTAAVLQESTQTCVDIIKMKQKQHCRKLQPQIKPTSKQLLKQRYQLICEIGHGLSGNVYKAKDILSQRQVAIKMVLQCQFDQPEYTLLKSITHSNIVNYYNTFIHNNKRCLVLEYFPYTLSSFVRKRRLLSDEVKHVFKNVVNGLLYLHGMAIAHRDIKMENVVVGEDLSIVKFIDFGLCIDMNSLRNRDEMCWQFCGTISYMPPEILRKQGYDPRKSDVWSLGVLLYCLAYGRFPYRGKDEGKVLEKIQNGRLVFPKDGDQGLKDIIVKMLNKQPKLRPTIVDIVNHRYLEKE